MTTYSDALDRLAALQRAHANPITRAWGDVNAALAEQEAILGSPAVPALPVVVLDSKPDEKMPPGEMLKKLVDEWGALGVGTALLATIPAEQQDAWLRALASHQLKVG